MNVCSAFGICGGCSKQNMPYDEQLKWKESVVRDALREVGADGFLPILPSPNQIYYRNKMEYSFGDENDIRILAVDDLRLTKNEPINELHLRKSKIENRKLVHLGLHPRRRFALVVPTPDCLLLSEESQQITLAVSEWASTAGVPSYVRKNASGVLRHLVIREGKNTGERLVNLVTTTGAADTAPLTKKLQESKTVTTFIWTRYDGLSDVASVEGGQTAWGEGHIYEKVGDLKIRVGPNTFMQTNTHASEMMINILREWMGSGDLLFDLYCGGGVIGLNMAGQYKKVIGIESNEASIANAQENAERNGIGNAEFHAGRVEDKLPVLGAFAGQENQDIIVDPPRAGLHPTVSAALCEHAARRIYYLSCNPESLARDLRVLGGKYKITRVQPMDFFPHTDHIETLVELKTSACT